MIYVDLNEKFWDIADFVDTFPERGILAKELAKSLTDKPGEKRELEQKEEESLIGACTETGTEVFVPGLRRHYLKQEDYIVDEPICINGVMLEVGKGLEVKSIRNNSDACALEAAVSYLNKYPNGLNHAKYLLTIYFNRETGRCEFYKLMDISGGIKHIKRLARFNDGNSTR